MPEKYFEELREIAAGEPSLEIVTRERPSTYGWTRQPQFDTAVAEAWEQPNGALCQVLRVRRSETDGR